MNLWDQNYYMYKYISVSCILRKKKKKKKQQQQQQQHGGIVWDLTTVVAYCLRGIVWRTMVEYI